MTKNSKVKDKLIWDMIVIGGGPSGMMAAGTAASRGLTTLLLEKNPILGKKLLITGGGRCNLTNHKLNLNTLIDSYKNRPKALMSAFSRFDVAATLDFFNSKGLETKIENEGRVFPITDKAESVWQIMIDYLKENNVEIKTNQSVNRISKNEDYFEIITNKDKFTTKSCVIATGGKSYPETGSTGDGFDWAKKFEHTVSQDDFSLVPVRTKEKWVENLSGLTLKDVKINIIQSMKVKDSKRGKLLFTHFGVSGPTILNMSSTIRDLLNYDKVFIEIDLLPGKTDGELKAELINLLESENNKDIKNALNLIIPARLIKILLKLAKIDPDKKCNSITKSERLTLRKSIKTFTLEIESLLGADKAIISAGGVNINEINFQTMESRIIPQLFLTGDMLNIDRPSGGYSLQICWSTGYVAGMNC